MSDREWFYWYVLMFFASAAGSFLGQVVKYWILG
jgi:hypothetical protein